MITFRNPESRTGKIHINSQPEGANIALDGENTGKKTPYTLIFIPTGNHRIKLEKSGYKPYEIVAHVVEDESVTLQQHVDVTLEPLPHGVISESPQMSQPQQPQFLSRFDPFWMLQNFMPK